MCFYDQKPDEENLIFTEGIDYSKTGSTSIWGQGDPDTLKLLNRTNISGVWLNLAAGDGRYNSQLLKMADLVIATDVDISAINKLKQNTPSNLLSKLKTQNLDISRKFPLKNLSFDGVFCTGTLHLFPEHILQKIIKEIDRILKQNGRLIFDFATNIKRILPNGDTYIKNNEPSYQIEEARVIIEKLLSGYEIEFIESIVPEEKVESGKRIYSFSCKFLLITAVKKH